MLSSQVSTHRLAIGGDGSGISGGKVDGATKLLLCCVGSSCNFVSSSSCNSVVSWWDGLVPLNNTTSATLPLSSCELPESRLFPEVDRPPATLVATVGELMDILRVREAAV